MQPLGKNHGGYFGETVDIRAVLRDIDTAARQHGWSVETILAAGAPGLPGLTRLASRHEPPATRIYISAGIHGDEPAGPLAVRQLLQEDDWPRNVDLWLCPCLNPEGFALNRRGNAAGTDLNRQYRDPSAAETLAHTAWLKRQPDFDLCLCLHEDWEARGFYLYELNPDRRPSLAEPIVEAVSAVCPVDLAETIEGRPARGGIIRPHVDLRGRPDWPEAFFLVAHKTRLSYTLEAPSDFPLSVRMSALVKGVKMALELGTKDRG